MSEKKQYGLIFKKNEPAVRKLKPMASVFGDDDDEESEKVMLVLSLVLFKLILHTFPNLYLGWCFLLEKFCIDN